MEAETIDERMIYLATTKEVIYRESIECGDHTSTIDQCSIALNGAKKPDIKELEAENSRLKEDIIRLKS